ncbi:MAG: helix-hairpin-helix domain-containing protein [Halobacteriota archaeon]
MKEGHSSQSLTDIPGVGKSIANDLRTIGIHRIDDLKGKDPELLYELSNQDAGTTQDRCLLYVFRCAVYFAETRDEIQDHQKLNWWYWKDKKGAGNPGSK